MTRETPGSFLCPAQGRTPLRDANLAPDVTSLWRKLPPRVATPILLNTCSSVLNPFSLLAPPQPMQPVLAAPFFHCTQEDLT
ncbi:MAG: hypothetical protein RIQ56_355 [Candidatus Parcubacteria bacterium]